MKKWITYNIEICSGKTQEELITLLKEETDEQLLFIPDKKMMGKLKADYINVGIILFSGISDPFKCRAVGKLINDDKQRTLKLSIWPNWKFFLLTLFLWCIALLTIVRGTFQNLWIGLILILIPLILVKLLTWIYGSHLENFLSSKLK